MRSEMKEEEKTPSNNLGCRHSKILAHERRGIKMSNNDGAALVACEIAAG